MMHSFITSRSLFYYWYYTGTQLVLYPWPHTPPCSYKERSCHLAISRSLWCKHWTASSFLIVANATYVCFIIKLIILSHRTGFIASLVFFFCVPMKFLISQSSPSLFFHCYNHNEFLFCLVWMHGMFFLFVLAKR